MANTHISFVEELFIYQSGELWLLVAINLSPSTNEPFSIFPIHFPRIESIIFHPSYGEALFPPPVRHVGPKSFSLRPNPSVLFCAGVEWRDEGTKIDMGIPRSCEVARICTYLQFGNLLKVIFAWRYFFAVGRWRSLYFETSPERELSGAAPVPAVGSGNLSFDDWSREIVSMRRLLETEQKRSEIYIMI